MSRDLRQAEISGLVAIAPSLSLFAGLTAFQLPKELKNASLPHLLKNADGTCICTYKAAAVFQWRSESIDSCVSCAISNRSAVLRLALALALPQPEEPKQLPTQQLPLQLHLAAPAQFATTNIRPGAMRSANIPLDLC